VAAASIRSVRPGIGAIDDSTWLPFALSIDVSCRVHEGVCFESKGCCNLADDLVDGRVEGSHAVTRPRDEPQCPEPVVVVVWFSFFDESFGLFPRPSLHGVRC
jgi:hypothetical protein